MAGCGLALCPDELTGRDEEARVQTADGLTQHGQLDRLADEARVLDRLDRDLADEGAALRADLD